MRELVRKELVHRRRFLQKLSLGASAPILAPMLGQMASAAAGASGPAPRRFVFFVQGNGIKSETITPAGVARPTKDLGFKAITNAPKFRELSLSYHDLPHDFEPLSSYKDRLTILMGLSGRACQGGHSNNFGALGVYGSRLGAAGETIDCALAKALPAPFPHISLGITRDPNSGAVYNISAWQKNLPAPMQCKPQDAYHALFGSITPTGQGDFDTLPYVLDFLNDDLKRVRNQLGGVEREKVDAYSHALGEMSRRHGAVREKDAVLRRLTPAVTPKFDSETETDRLEAHVEIGGAALIAGLTNCLVIGSGNGDSFFEVTYRGLGIGVNMHAIGHSGAGLVDGVKTGDELASIIRRFHLGLMARLADKLQAVPEGDGSMLDNTTIVFLSDSGDGHHAANWEFPMLVLGDLGGKLKTRGRYLEFPHYGLDGHRTIACFYNTLLQSVGVRRVRFGVLDGELDAEMQTGTLSELLV